MRSTILLTLSLLLLVPNFIPADINGTPDYNGKERYNPELGHIRSVAELESYVDACARLKNFDTHSPQYAAMLAYVISCRFYHGFSHWKMSENWIAALGEKTLGYGLASKVDPEEILQHPNAACSQQALVMMAVLRNKGISYRKVGFPHHYALEVQVNNQWYYFDPNMEPRMSITDRRHDHWGGMNDIVKTYYDPSNHRNLDYQFGRGQQAEIGPVNEIPAKNAARFQSVTAFLSKVCWLIPLCVLAFVTGPRHFMYPVGPVNRKPIYRLASRGLYWV